MTQKDNDPRLTLSAWCERITTEEMPLGQHRHDSAPLAEKFLGGTITEAEMAQLQMNYTQAHDRQ